MDLSGVTKKGHGRAPLPRGRDRTRVIEKLETKCGHSGLRAAPMYHRTFRQKCIHPLERAHLTWFQSSQLSGGVYLDNTSGKRDQ